MKTKIISAVLVLALTSLACGFSFNVPKVSTPGPEVTEAITAAAPSSGTTRLKISFGAGELHLTPGAQDKLVDGVATYNIPELKPRVTTNGGDVHLQQGSNNFSMPTLNNIKTIWDLKLGNLPMELSVEAGAYSGTMELGGLPLTALTVKDGAADVKLSFASPNPTEMSVLRYETGASTVTMSGLANANFNTMIFQAGAGDYSLDFSGSLKRDATLSMDCGLSSLTLHVPTGVHAIVTVESGLSDVNTSSGWVKDGNTYTQAGSGPTLTFIVKMGAGTLTLAN